MVRMIHTTNQSLYDYWNRLRGTRLAPRRFEIEPVSIGDALPDTFILERSPDGTFPFRLAGTRLCELFKREFRGHDFLAAWTAADSATLRGNLNTIALQGGVIVLLVEAQTASGKSIQLEIVVLPLIHSQVSADRFLGVVSPLDTPNWLGFDPLQAVYIVSHNMIWPDGHPRPFPSPTNEPDPDRQNPFLPRVRQSRIVRSQRRQFRVFDGGLSNNPTPPSKS